jgi:hypothetical protein
LATAKGQQADYIVTIRNTLQTQVAEILRSNVSELGSLDGKDVYDAVLESPALLQECLQLYRTKPSLFRRVAMGPDKRPVISDHDPLWCGRNMDDVMTLVVRASAKRYFRAQMPADPPELRHTETRSGLLHSTAVKLGLRKASPPEWVVPEGQGDLLYRAFRPNLRFDWQVALIPHYAPLEVDVVERLGHRILDLRDPKQLKILAEEGLTSEGQLPLMLSDAKRLLAADGSLDGDRLMEAFQKLGLEAVLPSLQDTALRRAVSQMTTTDIKVAKLLMTALGYDLLRSTMFWFTAFQRMEEKAYRQAFGEHGAIWAIEKLGKHLEGTAWPSSLPSLRKAMEGAIGFAIDLDSGLPAKSKPRAAAPAPAPAPAAKAPASAQKAPSAAAAPPPARRDADRAARSPMALAGR